MCREMLGESRLMERGSGVKVAKVNGLKVAVRDARV